MHGNDDDPRVSHLRFVTHETGDVRREEVAGTEYLVAPVVAVQSMVLKGEFLPNEEVEKVAPAFSGVPIPVGHPTANGKFVSANTPERRALLSIGTLFNTEFDDGQLRGEVWLNVEKANALAEKFDEDAFTASAEKLDNGEPLEVSTAYYYSPHSESGTHDGEQYDTVQRDLKPDHLAALPNATGECSVEDGCGAGVAAANIAANATDALDGVITCPTATIDSGEAPALPAVNTATGERRMFVNATVHEPPADDAPEDPEGALERVRSIVNGLTDSTDTDVDPDDGDDTTSTTMNVDYESLAAELEGFSVEDLKEMSDTQVAALKAATENSDDDDDGDDDDTAQNSNDNGDDTSEVLDAINSLREDVEALKNRDPGEEVRKAEARSTILDAHEELEASDLPDDVEKLEAMASTLGGASSAPGRGTANAREGLFGDDAEEPDEDFEANMDDLFGGPDGGETA